jgi:hypothetical protein
MEIVGTLECSVRYRYLGKKTLIDRDQVLAGGAHERIKNEFSFGRIPEPPRSTSFEFSQGKFNDHVVRELRISESDVRATLWGPTKLVDAFVQKVVGILEASIPKINLATARKSVIHSTRMTVRLDIDAKRIFADKFASLIDEFSDAFAVSSNSIVEVQFPVFGAVIASEPDIPRLLARCDKMSREDLESELQAASGSRSVLLVASRTQAYRVHEFVLSCTSDNETAERIAKRIEDVFASPIMDTAKPRLS